MIHPHLAASLGEGFVPRPTISARCPSPESCPSCSIILLHALSQEVGASRNAPANHAFQAFIRRTVPTIPRYARTDPGHRLLWRATCDGSNSRPCATRLLAIGRALRHKYVGAHQSGDRTLFDAPHYLRYIDRSDVPDELINFDFATRICPVATATKPLCRSRPSSS